MDRIIQDATAENKEDRLVSIEQLRRAILDAIRELKHAKEKGSSTRPGRLPAWHKPQWIWSGVILAILAVTAMTIWHLAGNPGRLPGVLESLPKTSMSLIQQDLRESSAIEITESDTPKYSILSEDGASMRFIPAGQVSLSADPASPSKRPVKVAPFYMDETLVTNHQYVEFLNQNLSRLRVERGVVNAEDDIWLLLGEVKPDYDPIVYQNGTFKVSSIAFASFPVLRVTAYGASSYARFYNRRLPTYTEWLYTRGADNMKRHETVDNGVANQQAVETDSMHNRMHGQTTGAVSPPQFSESVLSPVTSHLPNRFGIRGLNQNIQEWGLLLYPATSRDNIRDADFIVLPSTIQRYLWEGFAKVGFRCVRDVKMRVE